MCFGVIAIMQVIGFELVTLRWRFCFWLFPCLYLPAAPAASLSRAHRIIPTCVLLRNRLPQSDGSSN